MPVPCFTRPAVVLLFLAPVIGELLSTSSPPVEFFNPVILALQCALYGSGAILVRELRVYWRKGWLAVLLLGLAYAIVEEGMLCKSFFDPNWVDIGKLGEYGRWGGVNWVWTFQLSVFHSIYSIAISILLVELVFPGRREEHWVSPKCAYVLTVLLALVVALGYFKLTPFRPEPVPFVGFVVLAGVFVWLAKLTNWPRRAPEVEPEKPIARPWKFWLVGLVGGFAFMLSCFILPNVPGLPPVATTAVVAGIAAAVGAILVRMSGNGQRWGDIHRFSAAAGALGFFIFADLVAELDKNRTDNPTGLAAVGVVAIALLLWLRGEIAGRKDDGLQMDVPDRRD